MTRAECWPAAGIRYAEAARVGYFRAMIEKALDG
jgi:hypothetical protein